MALKSLKTLFFIYLGYTGMFMKGHEWKNFIKRVDTLNREQFH